MCVGHGDQRLNLKYTPALSFRPFLIRGRNNSATVVKVVINIYQAASHFGAEIHFNIQGNI